MKDLIPYLKLWRGISSLSQFIYPFKNKRERKKKSKENLWKHQEIRIAHLCIYLITNNCSKWIAMHLSGTRIPYTWDLMLLFSFNAGLQTLTLTPSLSTLIH